MVGVWGGVVGGGDCCAVSQLADSNEATTAPPHTVRRAPVVIASTLHLRNSQNLKYSPAVKATRDCTPLPVNVVKFFTAAALRLEMAHPPSSVPL